MSQVQKTYSQSFVVFGKCPSNLKDKMQLIPDKVAQTGYCFSKLWMDDSQCIQIGI